MSIRFSQFSSKSPCFSLVVTFLITYSGRTSSIAFHRLVPQLLLKGGILHSWKKKRAVALNKGFFDTLPPLKRVSPKGADIAWLIYDLKLVPGRDGEHSRFTLQKIDEVFTEFEPASSFPRT